MAIPRGLRAYIAAAMALFLALLVVGCAPPAANPEADLANGKASDTVKVGVHGPTLVSLHPAKTLRTGSQSIVWAIYPRLTELDGQGKVVPSSATSWERTSDNQWVFTLRDGVVYEQGQPFNADVVVWNFERYLDSTSDWTAASSWRSYIQSVKASGDHQVTITTKTPFLHLPEALATIFFLQPEWAQTHNPDLEAMGTGPYRLESYQQENKGVLVASDTYWGKKPDFTRVEVIGYAESATRLAALKNGEINLTITIDPVDLPDLRSSGNLVVGGSPGQRVQTLQFNFNRKPFQDQRVREALNYAIDRKSITDSIYLGTTEPNRTQVISRWYPGYEQNAPTWDYDPERAKQLLAEAGYAGGFTVNVNVPTATYAGAEQAIQVIAQSWAKLGVTLDISVLPSGPWGDRNVTTNLDEAPDLIYWGIQYPNLIAAYNLNSWTSNYRTNDGALPNQSEFDKIVKDAFAATDETGYLGKITEGSGWLRNNAALVYLWDQPQTYAYQKTLDWTPRYDDWIDYVNIKKAKS